MVFISFNNMSNRKMIVLCENIIIFISCQYNDMLFGAKVTKFSPAEGKGRNLLLQTTSCRQDCGVATTCHFSRKGHNNQHCGLPKRIRVNNHQPARHFVTPFLCGSKYTYFDDRVLSLDKGLRCMIGQRRFYHVL